LHLAFDFANYPHTFSILANRILPALTHVNIDKQRQRWLHAGTLRQLQIYYYYYYAISHYAIRDS